MSEPTVEPRLIDIDHMAERDVLHAFVKPVPPVTPHAPHHWTGRFANFWIEGPRPPLSTIGIIIVLAMLAGLVAGWAMSPATANPSHGIPGQAPLHAMTLEFGDGGYPATPPQRAGGGQSPPVLTTTGTPFSHSHSEQISEILAFWALLEDVGYTLTEIEVAMREALSTEPAVDTGTDES